MASIEEEIKKRIADILQPMSSLKVASYINQDGIIDCRVNLSGQEDHPCEAIADFVNLQQDTTYVMSSIETLRCMDEQEKADYYQRLLENGDLLTAMKEIVLFENHRTPTASDILKERLMENGQDYDPWLHFAVFIAQGAEGVFSLTLQPKLQCHYGNMPEVKLAPFVVSSSDNDADAVIEELCSHLAQFDPRPGSVEKKSMSGC